MKKNIRTIFLSIFCLAGCATPNQHLLRVDTTPADAIVSFHQTSSISDQTRQISGITPLKKNYDFGEAGQLWLEIEKRGYSPHIVKVLADTGKISIDLESITSKNGEHISDYTLPKINRILLAKPDIKIFERGFSSEKISEEKSALAQENLTQEIVNYFSERYEVVTVKSSNPDKKLLRPLWRDTQSAMELLDPIRLKYLARPPLLETKSSRGAAGKLGNKYGSEVMLFIKAKRNVETTGYAAGLTSLSIATSVVAGNAKTPEDQDSIEKIYAPLCNYGVTLLGKAALVDCSNGEILWVNRGTVDNILTSLFIAINHNKTIEK